MTKRKKRLKKGIEALKKQKKIHEEKREKARKLGQEELVKYYTGEINKFEREIEKKEEQLD